MSHSRTFAILIATFSLILTGCSSGPVAEADNLAPLKATTTASIRLYGLMDFESFGIKFSFPTTLEVTTVPIGWMNESFRGFKEVSGSFDKITDQIHGTISDDGRWLKSLVFTRQITRSSLQDGIFYQVEIKNIPLDLDSEETIILRKDGGDLQKHVVEISYYEQSYQNGQLIVTTRCVATDWTKNVGGQAPYLLVIFEEGNGQGLPPC